MLTYNSTFRKVISWHLVPSLHGKYMEKQWTVIDFILGGSKITADGDCSHEIKRCLLFRRKVMTNLGSILKSRDIINKGLCSQAYGFYSIHIWMLELDCKESWTPKNWCFWTVVLEKTLEFPLDRKNQPLHPKGNSVLNIHWKDWCLSWNPILWAPDMKN